MALCTFPMHLPLHSSGIHRSIHYSKEKIRFFHFEGLRATVSRGLHSAHAVKSAATAVSSLESTSKSNHHVLSDPQSPPSCSVYSCLPWPFLLRGLFVATITSSPVLISPSLNLLSRLAYSKNPLLLPSRNPIVRYALKTTLFSQFCAGETPAEVRATVYRLKCWGIRGILLGWAREVETREKDKQEIKTQGAETADDRQTISEWVEGTLQTVNLTEKGEFVSIKFTGAGHLNRNGLTLALPPTPTLAAGLANICARARDRGITLIIDAEQTSVQPGIEAWTLNLSREYNKMDGNSINPTNHPLIMGTYQAYLKATPARLSSELATASKENFTLGIKLVRGAYLGSDPRECIHDSKSDTDAAYNGMAAAILRRKWTDMVAPTASDSSGRTEQIPFPAVSLVLATHNAESVRRAMAIREESLQDELGNQETGRVPFAYAQLMGMADHISCDLVTKAKEVAAAAAESEEVEARRERDSVAIASSTKEQQKQQVDEKTKETRKPHQIIVEAPRPLKYLVWGSVDECLMYLVRRAEENRNAASRTVEERNMLWKELWRRLRVWA